MIECKFLKIISTDPLLVYESIYCLQVYLENYAYKSVNAKRQFHWPP